MTQFINILEEIQFAQKLQNILGNASYTLHITQHDGAKQFRIQPSTNFVDEVDISPDSLNDLDSIKTSLRSINQWAVDNYLVELYARKIQEVDLEPFDIIRIINDENVPESKRQELLNLFTDDGTELEVVDVVVLNHN